MSTQQRIFQIERFYFGNIIQNGMPIGSPGVIASSAGITRVHVQECLRAARVRPPTPELTSDEMPCTLGYFRKDDGTYVIIKAQRTPEGHPQLLYMLIPDIALRWLGGNYRLFESLGYEEMRTFDAPRPNLPPLMLEEPQILPDEDQIELIYDLFYYAGDNVKNVEGMLAALVHSQPVTILNSPLSLEQRMRFIQGILCLLPTPARVGITWMTHADRGDSTQAQITFVYGDEFKNNGVIYDWESGQLLTDAPKDNYSRFIVSQMRLDPSLVLDNTRSIARTAVWRAMRKESLPDALHFASRRAAIDSAVSNNQPADRETVAGILRQDPTLSDDMRLMYARHLLAFTIALRDGLEHSEVLPVVAAADRPVAEMIYQQLREVAEGENPLQVIDIVERWMVNVPQAKVIPWHQIAHIAVMNYLERTLRDGDTVEAIEFLGRIQNMHRALQMEMVVPQLIGIAQSSAAFDIKLAQAIFMLGVVHLPVDLFRRLISDPQLIGQLSERLQRAVYFLQPQPRPNPPANLLVSVAADFPEEQRLLVVARLAEVAIYLRRDELVTTSIIDVMLYAAQSGYDLRSSPVVDYLIEKYSRAESLEGLDQDTLELLPHLFFMTQRYQQGIHLLEHYQARVFGLENLDGFTETVGNVFLNSNLPLDAYEQIFATMEHSKLRPEPRVRSYCAVLIAVDWSLAYRNLARRLTIMLYTDRTLVDIIGLENALALLAFHANQKDDVSVIEIGSVLMAVALSVGKRGVELVVRVWEYLTRTSEMRDSGLNLLRQYVRHADDSYAMHLPAYFGKKLGADIGRKLQATYVMRQVMEGRDFMGFSEALHFMTAFLIDLAVPYYTEKEPPPRHRIRRGLDSMSGGLDENERRIIGENLEYISRAIYVLGQQQNRGKQATQRVDAALVRNEIVPETALDFLIFLGGRFARKEFIQVSLQRVALAHVFGTRSATMLLDESTIIANLMADLLQAFPEGQPPSLELNSLNEELDSLWKELTLYNQQQVAPALAEDAQYAAQLMVRISGRVQEKVFSNRQLEYGEQTPTNTIEVLRFISGYFFRKH